MSNKVRVSLVVVGILAIAFGTYSGYRKYVTAQHFTHIQSEQQDLEHRISGLRVEMQTPTTDPAEIKSRQQRLQALQRDLDSIKKESASTR
jgi:hypothetical protein